MRYSIYRIRHRRQRSSALRLGWTIRHRTRGQALQRDSRGDRTRPGAVPQEGCRPGGRVTRTHQQRWGTRTACSAVSRPRTRSGQGVVAGRSSGTSGRTAAQGPAVVAGWASASAVRGYHKYTAETDRRGKSRDARRVKGAVRFVSARDPCEYLYGDDAAID